MTCEWDENEQYRMFCDQPRCGTRSEPYPYRPGIGIFQDQGWYVSSKWGDDICPACIARGVKPKVEAHRPYPKAADLLGADPDYTGGAPVDEYIAGLRGDA